MTNEKFMYLWTFPDGKNYSFRVSDPASRHEMAVMAIEFSNAGFDVYHGVNLSGSSAPNSYRYTNEEIVTQIAIVVDIDIRSDAHKGDPTKYPPDFETAKSFLPFTPSILVNSGYGLHAYYLFGTPIKITDENREECEQRNKRMIELVKQRAGKYAKTVKDADLSQVLHVPGTFNWEFGKENAPLCKVVETNNVRFSPADIDEELNKLLPAQDTQAKETARQSTADAKYNVFRISRMLDKIRLCISALTYDDWLAFMSACKNLGVSYETVDEINRLDTDRYTEQENRKSWQTLNKPSFGIATLHGLAKLGGYSESETWAEYNRRADTTADKLTPDQRKILFGGDYSDYDFAKKIVHQ